MSSYVIYNWQRHSFWSETSQAWGELAEADVYTSYRLLAPNSLAIPLEQARAPCQAITCRVRGESQVVFVPDAMLAWPNQDAGVREFLGIEDVTEIRHSPEHPPPLWPSPSADSYEHPAARPRQRVVSWSFCICF